MKILIHSDSKNINRKLRKKDNNLFKRSKNTLILSI